MTGSEGAPVTALALAGVPPAQPDVFPDSAPDEPHHAWDDLHHASDAVPTPAPGEHRMEALPEPGGFAPPAPPPRPLPAPPAEHSAPEPAAEQPDADRTEH